CTTSNASSSESSTSSTRRGAVMSRHRRVLIDEQPIDAELAGGFRKLGEVHGFTDVAVASQTVTLQEILLFPRGRQHDHRQKPRAGILANAPEHLEPVDFRKLEIEENHRREWLRPPLISKEHFQSLRSVARDADRVGDIVFPEGEDREFL